MTMRRIALFCALAALLTGTTALAAPAGMTGKLACAGTEVRNLGPDPNALHITDDLLLAALKVAVRNRMPGLRVDDSCSSYLSLTVNTIHDGSDLMRPERFSAAVRLELRRNARVEESGAEGAVTVWDDSSLLAGRADDAQKSVLAEVEALADAFAAEAAGGGGPGR